MSATTTTEVRLAKHLDEQVEKGKLLLSLADRTGFFLWMATQLPDGTAVVPWPLGISEGTRNWVFHAWKNDREDRRKRPIYLRGTASHMTPGQPIGEALIQTYLEVPDRVAMRALNAPLQVIADGFEKVRYNPKSRLIACTKTGDHFEYRTNTPAGARAMWQVLISPPVRRMLLHGDHYSRARRAGED